QGFRSVVVRRNAPKRLFTNRPDAVYDVVQKPALAFNAFGDHQGSQRAAPGKTEPFEVAAVSGAGKFHETGCGELGPLPAEKAFAFCNPRSAQRVRQLFPPPALRGGRERAKTGRRQQSPGQRRNKLHEHRPIASFPVILPATARPLPASSLATRRVTPARRDAGKGEITLNVSSWRWLGDESLCRSMEDAARR